MKTLLSVLLILITAIACAKLPFSGPGLDTSSKMLPIAELRAIGIQWVRCVAVLPEAETRQVVRHYRSAGIQQLWILVQWDRNPEATLRMLKRCGVTDVEIFNEPEQGIEAPALTPEAYAAIFKKLTRSVVGPRYYGPAIGRYDEPWLTRAWKAGMRPKAITWHGYWTSIDKLKGVFRRIKEKFRIDSLCTEIGFPSMLGDTPYPLGGDTPGSFLALQRTLGSYPVSLYSGVEPLNDPLMGLFTWTGMGWAPNANYRMLTNLRAMPPSN